MSDFNPTEYIQQQKEAEARRRWHHARDTATDARMMKLRADDDNDPTPMSAAKAAQDEAEKAAESVDAVVRSAGVKESTLVLERMQVVRQRIEEWNRTLAIHQSYLDEPADWGGVDMGGAPLDPVVQAQHVQAYQSAIAAAEEELRELEAQAPPKKRGGDKS